MNPTLTSLSVDDRQSVIDLFNYYVENSFAAYPETRLPYDFFDVFLKTSEGYPTVAARDKSGALVGFGMLRPYNPIPTFAQTAEVAYFIKPGYTGHGIGKAMLVYLTEAAKTQGLTTLLASIASLNNGSIQFHKRNGFAEAGRLKNVIRKNGQLFDVVYYQKMI